MNGNDYIYMLYTVHICTYIWVTSTHVLKWWEFLQSSDFKFLPLLILKPFNSQHQSRHFQLQLLCISIFVLTLCPPNSQFGHFHLLHFVTLWRYEVRFQGQDQTALDKWLLLEVGWNAFLQPEERRLWKELCRPFRLDYDFLFFFPSMSFVSTLGHPSKALRGPSKSLTFSPLARRWELFRMSTRTWFLGFRGWKPGGRKSTNNKMFKGIQSMNPYQWLDTD